eukprot:GHRR01020870.1.p1 GENE.GHRR01020870.1~~GHRR01020870.1.p1  ORF type:complete len:819 (+),score=323.27 GHRR01020870.1:216-2672(+)
MEVELLLPLVRVGLMCLGVDSLQLLQAEAKAVCVAVFRAYPQQRTSVMDQVLAIITANSSSSGKQRPSRLFEASDAADRPLAIQMSAALLMEIVQASVQLPAVDAACEAITQGFRAAYGWSDYIWADLFGHLPAAKAAKNDGVADYKAVIDALLTDLLAVLMLPEWPAAPLLVRRFVKVLYSDKGLKHSDTAVKMASVDFTGQVAAKLCVEGVQADIEAPEVEHVLDAVKSAAEPSVLQGEEVAHDRLLHLLLLDYLAAVSGGHSNSSSSYSAAGSARQFWCCSILNDAIHPPRHATAPAVTREQLSAVLVEHRQLQDSRPPLLGSASVQLGLSRAQMVALVRHLNVFGPFGKGRATLTLIKWLVEAGSRQGPDPNPAQVRSKVFKCLGCIVDVDARVLRLPEVLAAVQAALEDDSISVREATLELVSKLITANPQLANEYHDVLRQASLDQSVSVRKRAIKSLWECCTCPGFTHASEALLTVLQRAGDQEESIRSLVTKICGSMWFASTSDFAGLSEGTTNKYSAGSTARSADLRAQELAKLCLMAYEADGKAIHVPLMPESPLLVTLKEILSSGSGSGSNAPTAAVKEQAAMWAGATEVAQALLGMVLRYQPEDDYTGKAGRFPHLLALHALCAADASVVAPAADPQRFVRCLAPYLAAASGQQGPGVSAADDAARRAAEELLCLTAVLAAALLHLGVMEQDVLQQMCTDLQVLINKYKFIQVVAAGCQTLCTVAQLYEPAELQIAQMATKCYTFALEALNQQQGITAPSPHKQLAPKVLFILGHLIRHGASTIDRAAEGNSSLRNCTECLELCVA